MTEVLKAIEQSGALPGGDGKDKSVIVEIYVHGLPPTCEDIHLYKLFCPFGQIPANGITAMQGENKGGGTCKGFGFVNFLAQESADLAIATLNGCQLPGGQVLRVEL